MREGIRIARLLCLSVLMAAFLPLFATHQRAAEITYTHVSGLTYEFTLTMYTYTPSFADDQRDSLLIVWGDGNSSYIQRIVFTDLGNDYSLNVYRQQHTYSSSGTYTVSVEDANRNYGVVNIPQSGTIAMYVESEVVINPFMGGNNSPQLLNPPIDQACVNKLFVHNPAASDPDGDSLVYHLISCRGNDGYNIPGYSLPDNMSINTTNGDIVWDHPTIQGEYNIAFIIEEYRQGIKIGSVMRDMQILVLACDNDVPDLTCPSDTCVIANDTLCFNITASDPDGVTLTAMGGPLLLTQSPAVVTPETAYGNPTATMSFCWTPDCLKVRKNPYTVTFKAKDSNSETSLTNLKTTNITVVGPKVADLSASPLANTVKLSWTPTECDNATGYYIYRREGQSEYTPDACETGVPAGLYSLIGTLHDSADSTFTDTDVSQGIEYCYRVVSFFADGAQSLSSDEVCTMLTNDMPLMTHVSNDSLNLESGTILVAWSTPKELDTTASPAPYKYVLKRSVNGGPVSIAHTAYDMADTCFVDNTISLNSIDSVCYSVDFYVDGDILFGTTQSAQAIRLTTDCSDNIVTLHWSCSVPWNIDSTQIFKKTGSTFVQTTSTTAMQFTDSDVTNNNTYSYYAVVFGHYYSEGVVKPIINYSAIVDAVPIDNIAPQPPFLSVDANCDEQTNMLSWTVPEDDDVEQYKIYFRNDNHSDFELIQSTTLTSFEHTGNLGCYYVTALDECENESARSNIVCTDYNTCPLYELPNVFTPNNDGLNDFFRPKRKSSSVTGIEIRIFNRWGRTVFETTDPEIMWDGKEMKSDIDVADGTYFYNCTIHFATLDGEHEQMIQGSVSIYREQ